MPSVFTGAIGSLCSAWLYLEKLDQSHEVPSPADITELKDQLSEDAPHDVETRWADLQCVM